MAQGADGALPRVRAADRGRRSGSDLACRAQGGGADRDGARHRNRAAWRRRGARAPGARPPVHAGRGGAGDPRHPAAGHRAAARRPGGWPSAGGWRRRQGPSPAARTSPIGRGGRAPRAAHGEDARRGCQWPAEAAGPPNQARPTSRPPAAAAARRLPDATAAACSPANRRQRIAAERADPRHAQDRLDAVFSRLPRAGGDRLPDPRERARTTPGLGSVFGRLR